MATPHRSTRSRTARSAVPASPGGREVRARRTRRTTQERLRILAEADRLAMTAAQVEKRFGVKPVTFYSWRRAAQAGRGAPRVAGDAQLARLDAHVRSDVRDRLRAILPAIVAEEVDACLEGLLDRPARAPRRRGKRRA